MKSFQLKDGDLDLGGGRQCVLAAGGDKLNQDLALLMMEPLGTSPLAPNYGSLLPDMVGSADPDVMAIQVEAEVSRLLSNYQASQFERLREARDNGDLNLWAKDELLNSIDSVASSVNLDTVVVTCTVRTASGADAALTLQVTSDGVTV